MGANESKLVEWQADSAATKCTRCDAAFTFSHRRHHCRFCGKVMCGSCTAWARADPKNSAITLRSCERCHDAGNRQASPVALPSPAKKEQSPPATAAAPAASTEERQEQPAPAAEPAPAVTAEPAPAVTAEPAPAVTAEPAPAVTAEPELTPEQRAQKLAVAQFLAAFVPFAEENGGASFPEMSAVLGAKGIKLTPAEIEAIGKRPAPGDQRVVPPATWTEPAPETLAPAPGEGEAFTLSPEGGAEPRKAAEGVASRSFTPLWQSLCAAADKCGDKVALAVEKPGLPADQAGTEWKNYTYNDYRDEARRFGKALLATGFDAFRSVAICGFNHPCWFFAHCGAIAVGGLSAGTYTTNSAEACAFVASDSKARVIAVDTVANLKKYMAMREQLPDVACVVVWAEEIPEIVKADAGDWAVTYDEFVARADGVDDADFDARAAAVNVKDCQSLIYTSGTTGNPKGVMMSHDAISFSTAATLEWLQFKSPEAHIVSFLPMSHIAAQIIDCGFALAFAAQGTPCTVHCARADALKGTLGATLKAARPTLFFGVPRVWEKFVEGIKAKGAASAATDPKTVGQLKKFAAQVGALGSRARQTGGDGKLPYGYELCKKAVFDTVREGLGLDRCEVCLTGAAPIPRQTLDFLSALGVDVLEVYGMSETSGMGTMSRRDMFKFGSCGPVTLPMELKTEHQEGRDKEGEGEICFRGRHVMMGYLGNEAKTREAIDAEGWMHSGDVGRIDEDGQVYITGRIKELIITAGGENIAPVPIEDVVKRNCPALSNVVMVGDKRKYNVCLVTIKSKQNLDTGAFTDELAGEAIAVNPDVTTVSAAREDDTWRAHIQAALDKYNAEATSNAQKIQKFHILSTDLSLPGGELTGTMKLKRNVVSEKYAAEIDAMYD